jgi:predicted XRE-type DNA-binding protein
MNLNGKKLKDQEEESFAAIVRGMWAKVERDLTEGKISQQGVASILGVSQARVSFVIRTLGRGEKLNVERLTFLRIVRLIEYCSGSVDVSLPPKFLESLLREPDPERLFDRLESAWTSMDISAASGGERVL